MIKHLFLFIVLLNTTWVQASEKIIECPPFRAWSSTSLEVSKVILSDTATTVYVKAFYFPGQWIRIAAGSYLQADDEQYTLRYGVGMEPDKEIWMPESGTYDFQMIFPPLPQGTKEIDFTEGNFNGAFSIYGIRLDGESIISPLSGKQNPKETSVLGKQELKRGIATVNGKMIGFTPSMHSSITYWLPNLLSGNMEDYPCPIQPDGTFCLQIPLMYTCLIHIENPYLRGKVCLTPGETLDIEVNLPEICRSQSRLRKEEPSLGEKYYCTGSHAALNNEMLNNPITCIYLSSTREEFDQTAKDICELNADQYKAYWLSCYQKKLHLLDQ